MPSFGMPRLVWTRATSGPVDPIFRSSAGTPGAMARLAVEAAATSGAGPPAVAANTGAVGPTAIAAVTAADAFFLRAISRRPFAARARGGGERLGDFFPTPAQAQTLCGGFLAGGLPLFSFSSY